MNEKEINTPREAAEVSKAFHDEFDPNADVVFRDSKVKTGETIAEFSRPQLEEENSNLQRDLRELDRFEGPLLQLSNTADDDSFIPKLHNILDGLHRAGAIDRSVYLGDTSDYSAKAANLKQLTSDEGKISELVAELEAKIVDRRKSVQDALGENQGHLAEIDRYLEEERLPEVKSFANNNLDLLKKAAFAEATLDGKEIALSSEDEAIVLAKRAAEKIITKE